MKKIAIEEHFFTRDYIAYMRSGKGTARMSEITDKKQQKHEVLDYLVPRTDSIKQLLEVGEGRLRDMDEAGIDMQVLSFSSPGVEAMDTASAKVMAKKTNDELAKIISKHPDRFAGFATIASHEPASAANEFERAVKELGLKGVKINSHVMGDYLDDTKYWVIFERAEKLGVPVYLHPRSPSPDMLKPYLKYPILVSQVWGFAAETGLHAMRLICSGLFDKHPGLKVILGHLGEGLPFWLWRIDDHRWDSTDRPNPLAPKIRKKLSQYVKDNFFVTTSGNFWMPAFLCTYMALGADRIMFAVDSPIESAKEAIKLVETAPICDADKDKIFHTNAEKLLGL